MRFRRRVRERKRLKILVYRTIAQASKRFVDTGVEDYRISDSIWKRWVNCPVLKARG